MLESEINSQKYLFMRYIVTGFFIIGALFAIMDTSIMNAEVSPMDPDARDILKNLSMIKILIYATMGAVAGLLLSAIIKLVKNSKR